MNNFWRYAVVLLFLSFIFSNAVVAESHYIQYSEFISRVEAGKIISVKLTKYSRIFGTQSVAGQEQDFRSYAETGSFKDPLLIQFLEKDILQ